MMIRAYYDDRIQQYIAYLEEDELIWTTGETKEQATEELKAILNEINKL